ncbi:MAG: hypothetical protein ABI591_27940 [Kofleriaceae bacterium]
MVGAYEVGCGGGGNAKSGTPECSDGIDNDGDGLVDFPDDPGCESANGSDEGHLQWPQCSDGRDNDGDGKIDFPYDPGCLAPQQDTETDDCPDGPNCPQCSNGKDDDNNGVTDFPNDPGCTSAADNDEFTDNPAACATGTAPLALPFDGHVTGTIDPVAISHLSSPTCGGGGGEQVYELRIMNPKVVTATTDLGGTNFDTVLYVRPADCIPAAGELTCNDDFMGSTQTGSSSLAISLATPGVYYLVVDSHDAGTGGNFEMQVDFLAGEGEPCDGNASCGTGLVCRIPLGGSQKVCAKHVCSDGIDDDGDGKLDYPNDPGCQSPDDDDETDTCPGVGCPECADGIDNDHDGQIDYPNDVTCTSAADNSESCPSSDGVALITGPATMGDISLATVHDDVTNSCSYEAGSPDLTYRLDLPAVQSLTLSVTSADLYPTIELYGATCGGTAVGGAAVGCQEGGAVTEGSLAAGSYYVVVENTYADTFEYGPFTLNVSGKIATGGSCESSLVAAGVLSCPVGDACKGTVGMRTCQHALCSDGIDNDGDGKIDYPFDPGCTDPGDDTEANPTTLPVCGDGMDNDADGTTDFPADYGCSSAAGASEKFCMTEMDATALITAKTTVGTTVGKSNDHAPTCQLTSAAPDIVYALSLPVPVASLVIDTNGSAFDTVLSLIDTQCTATIACNDDGGTFPQSKLTLTNMLAGNYAVIIDAYQSNSGATKLNVNGIVAPGTACTAAAFTGANAWLTCPTGTTCTGGTCH